MARQRPQYSHVHFKVEFGPCVAPYRGPVDSYKNTAENYFIQRGQIGATRRIMINQSIVSKQTEQASKQITNSYDATHGKAQLLIGE